MIKPEQVPDAVIDAAVEMRDRGGSMSDIIRTALNAWPGMRQQSWTALERTNFDIVLPLPQEPSDAEA